jgi:hypothetical protein
MSLWKQVLIAIGVAGAIAGIAVGVFFASRADDKQRRFEDLVQKHQCQHYGGVYKYGTCDYYPEGK